MDDSVEDQRKPHQLQPEQPVSLEQLKALGLVFDKYESDPELDKILRENHWMDIMTIYKDTLLNYEEKLKIFFEEHLHLDDEFRYILEGSDYFDVRDKDR
ncbi:hypothetical protein XELAEV_18030047mg [Xenopus laevis]|uniref:acireductone dioxygenase (Fe(2+)-requiring) n=1 Tax=Xenopus laevis TaxID=8355 RepID=A0A974CUF3_XENLA|nr:hypothetical protein XELAEV_18030047mg [Xenopus laevis]